VIILGIDPGLANTGWGIVETKGPLVRARAYGCVTTPAADALPVRLNAIFSELTHAIERFSPTSVAIEKIFFGQNTKSAIATAHARGAALCACAQMGCDVGEYTPLQIKQAVVGNGMASKDQVTYMVRTLLALDHDPKPDHAADALAAAICHAHLSRTLGAARS
jgi:crossover junction endodeoxyribonuclease RuvC